MKKILFLSSIFVVIMSGMAYSRDSLYVPANNIEIFSNLLNKSFSGIRDALTTLGKDKIYFLKFEKVNPEADFFTREINRELNNYKIITTPAVNPDYKILIENLFYKINYTTKSNNFFANRIYYRNISIAYKYKITKNPDDSLIINSGANEQVTDEIDVENLDQVEKSNFNFTRGIQPEQNFFHKILIPATIVVATLITIVLFYSIRSK